MPACFIMAGPSLFFIGMASKLRIYWAFRPVTGAEIFNPVLTGSAGKNIVESIVVTWRELLIVVALILAVYIAEMLLLLRTGGGVLLRRRAQETAKQDNAVEAELRADIASLNTRIAALEKYIVQLQAENATEATPYNRAIQLAKQGRDASRISESCGISRGEAELIVSMHGPRNDT
jgi:hypothetical protein